MKAVAIRKLAEAHERDVLEAAADTLAEGGVLAFEVEGEDAGEQMTHLMLASRVRERMATTDEDLKTAWRAVMQDVRGVLTNAPQ